MVKLNFFDINRKQKIVNLGSNLYGLSNSVTSIFESICVLDWLLWVRIQADIVSDFHCSFRAIPIHNRYVRAV